MNASKLWNVARWTAGRVWDACGQIPDDSVLKSYLKSHERYADLNAQSSQATLEELDEAFKSWYGHRDNGNERANPPGYRKNGDEHPRSTVTFKEDDFKHDARNGYIRLSKGRNTKAHWSDFMAAVSRIRLYPVKSLSGVDVESVSICDAGRLQHDHEYALFSEDGTYVNGRQNKLVHQINTTIDLAANTIDFEIHDTDRTFSCDLDGIDSNPELEAWLTDFFDESITVERAAQSNFTDSAGGIAPIRVTATGPTLVGEETVVEVASWYDDLDADGIFRRLRTNIAISGVESFWEDKLYSNTPATRRDPGTGVEFTVGDVTHYGVM